MGEWRRSTALDSFRGVPTPTLNDLEAALADSPGNILLKRRVLRANERAGRHERSCELAREILAAGHADATVKVVLAECYRRLGKTGAGLLITEELFADPDRDLAHADELALREVHLRLLVAEGRIEDATQAYLGFELADPGWGLEELARAVRVRSWRG